MKLADLYYDLTERRAIINGEYEGGTWQITHIQGFKFQCFKTPRHCRGMLSLGETENLLDALALIGQL
jgi:hypothetical protein